MFLIVCYNQNMLRRGLSEEDKEYLQELKTARRKIVTGAQSYTIGTRNLTRADLKTIMSEIARLEAEAGTSTTTARFRRVIFRDNA
jgi:hypothetical protein